MINKRCLPLVFAIFCLGSLACAQDYSADMVGGKTDGNATKGKIYVSGDKARFESIRENGHGGVMLWTANRRVVLMPERKMYMELGDMLPAKAFAFWRPTDIENACPEWQRASLQMKEDDNKITSCNKVGHDIVNGRPAVKYEGASSDGKKSQVWIDAKVRSVVKVVDNEGGGMELQNIQESTQPASLFEIPSDYQKFDMGAMKNHQH